MPEPRRIYVASSWRNDIQPEMVNILRTFGHEVYDFKNPRPGDTGFKWSDIEPDWQEWDSHRFRNALDHPIAEAGFRSDIDNLDWADTCILVMPCGRSAHLELGYAVGKGKATAVFFPRGEHAEPELMLKMVDKIAVGFHDLHAWLSSLSQPLAGRGT